MNTKQVIHRLSNSLTPAELKALKKKLPNFGMDIVKLDCGCRLAMHRDSKDYSCPVHKD